MHLSLRIHLLVIRSRHISTRMKLQWGTNGGSKFSPRPLKISSFFQTSRHSFCDGNANMIESNYGNPGTCFNVCSNLLPRDCICKLFCIPSYDSCSRLYTMVLSTCVAHLWAFDKGLSQETPIHKQLSSIVPQTSTNVFIERSFVEAAQQMKGNFWGPVSVKKFFDQFLDVKTDPMPEIDFKAVKDDVWSSSKLSFRLFEHVLIQP